MNRQITCEQMSVPTFSLVIPNLNQSHFLPFAMESLRHQSAPFRLAVMDGGSVDNFPEVLKQYTDIVTYSRSAIDGGQAAAICEGLERVSGEIVSWLNADDYLFPGALDRVAALFEADPLLDVVYGDAIHVSGDGLFLSYFPPIQEFDANDLTRTCFICQPACFVRRSAYERVGGVDSSLVYTMDWDLWCRLARSGAKFQYLPEPLAAVRYYYGTKTLSGNRKRYMEVWRIEREYGGRLLPLSWFGLYLFHLIFKSKKTIGEKAAFNILKSLRYLKKILIRSAGVRRNLPQTMYGFHRWEPVVESRCTIHLPWYDKRQWKKINLQVEPIDWTFEIVINNFSKNTTRAEGNHLVIDVPLLDDPYRRISITCRDGGRWRLVRFGCEFS
jgi:glycosyltransferase involved in cell wall biosynthesis